jgi:hypothetical protein
MSSSFVDDIDPAPTLHWVENALQLQMTDADVTQLHQVADLLGMTPTRAIVELIRRAVPPQNGHGFQAICDNCGLPYTAFHRPKSTLKHFCQRQTCKREAAADRARRYRARKQEVRKQPGAQPGTRPMTQPGARPGSQP